MRASDSRGIPREIGVSDPEKVDREGRFDNCVRDRQPGVHQEEPVALDRPIFERAI